jgi:hypothetical protein
MYCARHASIITFTKIFESQQFLKVFGSKKTKRRKHGHIYPEGERTLALLMTLFRTCMLDGFVRYCIVNHDSCFCFSRRSCQGYVKSG